MMNCSRVYSPQVESDIYRQYDIDNYSSLTRVIKLSDMNIQKLLQNAS